MLVLQLVQLVVQAALCQQFLMGAFLPDLALVHDDDLVAVLDGGQAVCHDDGGTALHQLVQRIVKAYEKYDEQKRSKRHAKG